MQNNNNLQMRLLMAPYNHCCNTLMGNEVSWCITETIQASQPK